MLKVEIKFIDNTIDVENKIERLDRGFSKYGLQKEVLLDGTICYKGNNKKNDYAAFGMLIYSLHDKGWFVPYLSKWLWYNSDGNENPDDYNIEDLLYHYTKKESIV